jgi:hypothetical protein
MDRGVLSAWLAAHTDVAPQDVFAVGTSSIVALTSVSPAGPDGPGMFKTVVHAEVIDARIAAEEGYLSWMARIDVDCANRRARTVELFNYPQRGLVGAPNEAAVPSGWVAPTPGARLFSLVEAVCEKDFPRPFAVPARAPSPLAAAAIEPEASVSPAPSLMRPPPSTPIQAGDTELQVTAAASWLQAREALETARQRFHDQMGGLESSVVRTTVDGAIVYRALFSGFRSAAQAQALCAAMKAQGHPCFVRQEAGA